MMPFLGGIDHRVFAIGSLALTSGIAAFSTYKLWAISRRRRCGKGNESYETPKVLNEYLLFHFGSPSEVQQWDFGPKDGLDFPKRCADLCMEFYRKEDSIPNRALDIGCAVGRSSFELARVFDEVVGIDYSHSFIDACNQLKESGKMEYSILDQGQLSSTAVAKVPQDIDRSKTVFKWGDACNLPLDMGTFGCIVAANLICRLHLPIDFLHRLKTLVAPGGILVILSPYTFLSEYTKSENLIGGYIDKNGQPYTAFEGLEDILGKAFEFVQSRDMPFFIRETARKNQWTVSHATVWRRKK